MTGIETAWRTDRSQLFVHPSGQRHVLVVPGRAVARRAGDHVQGLTPEPSSRLPSSIASSTSRPPSTFSSAEIRADSASSGPIASRTSGHHFVHETPSAILAAPVVGTWCLCATTGTGPADSRDRAGAQPRRNPPRERGVPPRRRLRGPHGSVQPTSASGVAPEVGHWHRAKAPPADHLSTFGFAARPAWLRWAKISEPSAWTACHDLPQAPGILRPCWRRADADVHGPSGRRTAARG